MNPMKSLCLLACLLAGASAAAHNARSNSLNNNLRPTEWLSASELESLPAVNEITLQQLEKMSVDEGANLLNKIYHLSQTNWNQRIEPNFVPNANDIPAYIAQPNGQRVNSNLNQLVGKAKQQQNFGNQEVTVLITGLPQENQAVRKATRMLVQNYMQRYNGENQQQQQNQGNTDYDSSKQARTSSEEDYNQVSQQQNQKNQNQNQGQTGNLVVIDLGATLNNFQRFAMLDIERTGAMIARVLVQLTNEANVPQEIVHIIGQGIGAHVAGSAGRQYTRLTGHQLRRITGLDPSRIFAKPENRLTGLARGDAEFVDAIHTSAYGMGTATRVGNVDFYPNGPNAGVPGADNVVEASMRATRYFAESVRPGNERNFPAVEASSLQQYKNNNGQGPRAYMGINAEFDLEGDYILQVNSKAPFGKRVPAQRQNTYHEIHQGWNKNNSNEN